MCRIPFGAWAPSYFLFCFALAAADPATQQPAPPSTPDELVCLNGERLLGHFESADSASVKFKSDAVGDVTIPWNKIKELRADETFTVIPKNAKVRPRKNPPAFPQGSVVANAATIDIKPRADSRPEQFPLSDIDHVVDQASFERAIENPGFVRGWSGSVTAGAALVVATQNSRTFTSNVTLLRSIPLADWTAPGNRTRFDFSSAYGILTQPSTPEVKTSIYHAAGERDEYITDRTFGFGQASFDHNFSQGLDLQSSVGAGFGRSIIKSEIQELDLKASMQYVKQQFQAAAQNQNLIGSVFEEAFNRKFGRRAIFVEQISATPTWNNLDAWSAAGNATLSLPITRVLQISLGVNDTFLNNPAPGFRKNSLQVTTGLTYALR